MKEKVCCIYDENEKYALKLADYINSGHVMPYQTVVYTSKEALLKNADRYEIGLLVIDGTLQGEIIEKIEPEAVVYLSETADTELCEDDRVCRYQPADHLVKELAAHLPGHRYRECDSANRTMVGCIYSSAAKCFKTTLSLGLAMWSAVKGKSLYINLEQFAGLSNLLSPKEGGLSAALYYFKSGGRNSLGKIISCTSQIEEFDYFYPVTCAEDISELDEKEFADFLNMIIDSGIYRYIWIDAGCAYKNIWKLLEISDRVLMPEPLDILSQKKVTEMENYLASSGRNELLGKIEKVSISYDESAAGNEITFDHLRKNEMKRMVKQILEVSTDG